MSRKISMDALEQPKAMDRGQAEARAVKNLREDGRKRRKRNQPNVVLIRQTDEERNELELMANVLGAMKGMENPATFADTIRAALDALKEKLAPHVEAFKATGKTVQ